ncbi:MAG: helicase [Chitinivibrionales bacterium]|nr:helicase [Chitinivibrionales bacterium]MBD3396034.1 helicase [Chitinivibrionales bacterium]
MNAENPLIVQSNRSLLLEVDHPRFKETRDAIGVFAHLEKSPEYVHTYSITPLSLWNAASLGLRPHDVLATLERYSRYPLPQNIVEEVPELMGRFGRVVLEGERGSLLLRSSDRELISNLSRHPKLAPLLGEYHDDNAIEVDPGHRGVLKQVLIGLGYPAHDRAGYVDGEPFEIRLRETSASGEPFQLRQYQRQAAESFVGSKGAVEGSGVLVLPCGAGKTIVGLHAMSLLKRKTLILVTSITAARQWRREIADKTTISDTEVGEYSGESKDVRPVTLATYQILTYRKSKTGPFEHYDIFNRENWGLIIYDEVHLLPAPVFKFTAELQARRRLGLTATLVREDGHEDDVFALIGPKKFDVPWKDLERQGWIATARCVEIRVDLPHGEKLQYLSLPARKQIRLAYENPHKIPVVREIIEQHAGDQILIIGQYLSQIDKFAMEFGAPVVTGATPNQKRDELYDRFRRGELKMLVLSKVGNFAVDLPDANVAIQISGSFGSRQEEAQRLGRILRPKAQGEQATFYSIVTRETKELDFAMKRQLFLTEQGYAYEIRYREFD